jgi:WS/DGAT/MGAT family acyltransferase
VGLFVRMHHAIADGMAGVATIVKFLDATPDAVPASPRAWTPAPVPTEGELVQDKWRRRLQRLSRMLAALAHPVTTGRHFLAAWPAMREIIAGRPLPATSLDRLVGPDRNLALIRSSLKLIKGVAHTSDATVNDVLLTVTAGGLRALLNARGESVEGVLRIYVPVSLHQEPRAQARGNLIGQMVVPLPIGVSDPVLRLRLIAKDTGQRKATSRPSLGMVPHRGIAGRAFLKLLARQRVNVNSADIPGPEAPLYFAGSRLLEVFPMVQLIGKVSLAVGAISYAGQFNIMVVADRDAYPDADIFVAGVQDELRALAARRSADVGQVAGAS